MERTRPAPAQAVTKNTSLLALAEDATDRGLVPGERPLSFEVLVGLAAVVAAIAGGKET